MSALPSIAPSCATCIVVGATPASSPSSPGAALWDEGWAAWTCEAKGVRRWICDRCWRTRSYAEIAGAIGPASSIWYGEGEVSLAEVSKTSSFEGGRLRVPSREEFVLAAERLRTGLQLSTEQSGPIRAAANHAPPAMTPHTAPPARGSIRASSAAHAAASRSGFAPILGDLVPGLELTREVGVGATGIVYEGRRHDERVAVKVLHARLLNTVRDVERFRREALTMAQLDHPNIVRLFDHIEHTSFQALLMEYVDGVTLREVIAQRALAPRRALEIAEAIARALEHAHELGVVHRDVKPDNVLLSREGAIKLGDFGLAKLDKSAYGMPTLTRRDGGLGTPAYMAPEQRVNGHVVDARADLYALGVILYEMLTGGRFVALGMDGAIQRRAIDPSIDALLDGLLALDPDDRERSARVVADRLLALKLAHA